MQVTNEIVVLNYSAGVLSYSVGFQKGVTMNPNLALWEDLDEEKLLFAHSTSWRFIDNELIITWLALPKEQCVLDRIYVESPIVGSEWATRPEELSMFTFPLPGLSMPSAVLKRR